MKLKNLLLAGAMMCGAGAANAGAVDEVRLGVMAHNICVANCDNANKEDGPNINGEVLFASPDFLSWAFDPHPYLMASVNTAGNTNFAGGGLQWSIPLGERFALEPGLGYVLQDGDTKDPFPQGSPESFEYSQNHVLLGSEDLFRTSLALSY